jgi:hypothetical protein
MTMRSGNLPEATAAPPAAARHAVGRGLAAGAKDDYSTGTAPAAHHYAQALEDRRLADRLLALPRHERQLAVEGDRRYHRLSLARLFVLAAEEALLGELAGDAEPAAELACAIVLQLPGEVGERVRRTGALAHWLAGKARLRGGASRGAAQAFETMFAFIPDQAPSTERGLCAYGFAQLYADERRDEAAIGMGTVAARQFSLLGAAGPAAACHAQTGLLLQEAGDLEQASFELMKALRVLGRDPALAPSLTARLLLALACVEAILGHAAAARQRLRSARRVYVLADSPGESVERAWREGQAAAAAGQLAAADRRLDQVRRQLLDAGSAAEAARATLDQAQVRIDAGRVETVEALAAALAAACPGDGEAWAKEIAGLGRVPGGGVPGEGYRVARELRRSLRQAAAPGGGGQRVELIVPWRMLTDRLLRGHEEGGGPSMDVEPHAEPKP